MKFRISRASTCFSDECPFDGAVLEGDEWTIEVESLEDLLNIHRDLIVSARTGMLPEITIYDDYVE